MTSKQRKTFLRKWRPLASSYAHNTAFMASANMRSLEQKKTAIAIWAMIVGLLLISLVGAVTKE